jgi:3',5'-cyclic AMP phosphodiesterase CpdA
MRRVSPCRSLKTLTDRTIHFAALLCVFALPLPGQTKAALPLKPGSVRFAVVGDMGNGRPPQYQTAREMAEARKSFPFDFVITDGDNIYGSASPLDLQVKFERPYRSLLEAGVEFYASRGNHDQPEVLTYKLLHMNGRRYYRLEKSNVVFFFLDSNQMDSGQVAWLEQALARAGDKWKICVFHHPIYSAAAFHGPALELRRTLEPIFIKYGVNAAFSGHDHVYERVKPQHGVHYFTEGASGQLRFGNLRPSEETAAGFDRDNSFMLVEIAGDEMYFETLSRIGQTVDSGVIERVTR